MPGWVCTVIGTPVRAMRPGHGTHRRGATPPVRPFSSMAHLRNAALTPVPVMPSTMSSVNIVIIGSGSSEPSAAYTAGSRW